MTMKVHDGSRTYRGEFGSLDAVDIRLGLGLYDVLKHFVAHHAVHDGLEEHTEEHETRSGFRPAEVWKTSGL